MDTEKYLSEVLKRDSLNDESPEIKSLREEKNRVEKIISDSFDWKPVIRYAGSYKKGTMIKASYDLDVVSYFKHDDDSAGETLEEIYNNVKKILEDDYYIEPKKSALRLTSKKGVDFHIDVVPGRFVDEDESDAFLYQFSSEKKRLKTNLDVHIDTIKKSQLVKVIKLVKIWKSIYYLNVKTFVLELLVVKVLKDYKDSDGLSVCLKKFFEELSTNIDNISVEDPANSGNDLSDLFNQTIKSELSNASSNALNLMNDEKIETLFGNVEEVSKDYIVDSIKQNYNKNNNSPKPWSIG